MVSDKTGSDRLQEAMGRESIVYRMQYKNDVYIGKHSYEGCHEWPRKGFGILPSGYYGSSPKFKELIGDLSFENQKNMNWKILSIHTSEKEALNAEKKWIDKYNDRDIKLINKLDRNRKRPPLSNEEINIIKIRHKSGESSGKIAQDFGISGSYIRKLTKTNMWEVAENNNEDGKLNSYLKLAIREALDNLTDKGYNITALKFEQDGIWVGIDISDFKTRLKEKK